MVNGTGEELKTTQSILCFRFVVVAVAVGGGGWRHIVWAIISLSCISLIVVEKELFLLNRTE